MTECAHGEPRGSLYCALCRRAGVEGKPPGPVGPWETHALHALAELAATRQAFTSEDLTDKAGYPARHAQNLNNRIGLFIQHNAKRFNLSRLRMEKARNPQSNGRLITVWIAR